MSTNPYDPKLAQPYSGGVPAYQTTLAGQTPTRPAVQPMSGGSPAAPPFGANFVGSPPQSNYATSVAQSGLGAFGGGGLGGGGAAPGGWRGIAMGQLGVPYVWGGSTAGKGLDCSGFTQYVASQMGVNLPHNAAAQWAAMPHVAGNQARPGDMLFFYGQNPGTPGHGPGAGIGHVAIYLGNGQMISTDHPGDRVEVEPVWWNLLAGAGRPW